MLERMQDSTKDDLLIFTSNMRQKSANSMNWLAINICHMRDLSLEHSINGQIDWDLRLCHQTKSDAVKWDNCPCSWCWLNNCENMCRVKKWNRIIKFILPPHKYTCNVQYRYLSLWLLGMISFYGKKICSGFLHILNASLNFNIDILF